MNKIIETEDKKVFLLSSVFLHIHKALFLQLEKYSSCGKKDGYQKSLHCKFIRDFVNFRFR